MSNFNSPQPSTLINSSMLLKGVLSIPSTASSTSTTISISSSCSNSSISNSSTRSISPDFTTTSKIESQSPTNVGKKNSSPDSKSSRLTNNCNNNNVNNSSKKAKKRPSHAPLSSSSTSLPTSTVTNPSNYFFAGSDFMNSPDPLTIPIPNFDDVDDFFSNNLSQPISTQFGSLNFTSTTISSSNSSDSITSSSSFNNSSCSSLEDKTSALRRILQVK